MTNDFIYFYNRKNKIIAKCFSNIGSDISTTSVYSNIKRGISNLIDYQKNNKKYDDHKIYSDS